MNTFKGGTCLRTLGARSGRWKYLVGVGLVVVALLLFCLPKAPDDESSWVSVTRQKLEHEIGLVGKIEPMDAVIINAPFEGSVLANELTPGMQVEKGQALLSFDPALLEIKIRDALANKLKAQQNVESYRRWATGPDVRRAKQALRVAELSMQNLELEYSNVEALYQKGIVPRNERDTLEQQRYLQSLELVAAQAELKNVLAVGVGEARTIADMEYMNASVIHEQLSQLLEKKTLYAPFSGVVLSVGTPQATGAEAGVLQQGASFTQGLQVLKLANMEGLKVVAQVSEADVGKFSLNQPVIISGDGFSGQPLGGFISAISQLAIQDENAGAAARFPVTVTLTSTSDNDLQSVRLGMSVHMTIVTYSNDSSFIIPHAAIEKDGDTLFVEHRDGLDAPVVRRAVTTGQSTVQGVEVFGVTSGFVRVR